MQKNIFNISSYISDVVTDYPCIKSIWLIGSRANDTGLETSDWDLLIFADQKILKNISKNIKYNLQEVDLLIVYDGNNFQEPWLRENGKHGYKKGNLKSWNWKISDNYNATYESDISCIDAKETDEEGFVWWTPKIKELKAIKM